MGNEHTGLNNDHQHSHCRQDHVLLFLNKTLLQGAFIHAVGDLPPQLGIGGLGQHLHLLCIHAGLAQQELPICVIDKQAVSRVVTAVLGQQLLGVLPVVLQFQVCLDISNEGLSVFPLRSNLYPVFRKIQDGAKADHRGQADTHKGDEDFVFNIHSGPPQLHTSSPLLRSSRETTAMAAVEMSTPGRAGWMLRCLA